MPQDLQKIGIFGAGLSGCAAYHRAKNLGLFVVMSDDSPLDDQAIQDKGLDKTDLSAWQSWNMAGLDAVILSPGAPHLHPAPHPIVTAAIDHNVPVISEVAFGLATGNWGDVVVITGTNGKSTTTALTAHILKQAGKSVSVGGNLGTPLCALEDQPDGITVLELSSYQLETTPNLACAISALLNITPDHLDRHGGIEGYQSAKRLSLSAVKTDGLALLGSGNQMMSEAIKWAEANLDCAISVISDEAVQTLKTKITTACLAGDHNAENAAFAAAIANQFGVDQASILTAINDFEGLPHRLQPVANWHDVAFINDSKATNGDATAKALSAFDNIIWLAGGRAKDDGLAACEGYFDRIKTAYFYGECANAFSQEVGDKISNQCYGTLDDAFAAATSALTGQEVVLLSPAAASFDQFPNFGTRGHHFITLTNNFILSASQKEVCHAR